LLGEYEASSLLFGENCMPLLGDISKLDGGGTYEGSVGIYREGGGGIETPKEGGETRLGLARS
jgi:hypothetical protein